MPIIDNKYCTLTERGTMFLLLLLLQTDDMVSSAVPDIFLTEK